MCAWLDGVILHFSCPYHINTFCQVVHYQNLSIEIRDRWDMLKLQPWPCGHTAMQPCGGAAMHDGHVSYLNVSFKPVSHIAT